MSEWFCVGSDRFPFSLPFSMTCAKSQYGSSGIPVGPERYLRILPPGWHAGCGNAVRDRIQQRWAVRAADWQSARDWKTVTEQFFIIEASSDAFTTALVKLVRAVGPKFLKMLEGEGYFSSSTDRIVYMSVNNPLVLERGASA